MRPAAEPVSQGGRELLEKEGVVWIVIAFKHSDTSESGNLQDRSFQEKPIYQGRKLQSVMKKTSQRWASCRHCQVPGRTHSCKVKTQKGNGNLILFYFLFMLLIYFIFNHLQWQGSGPKLFWLFTAIISFNWLSDEFEITFEINKTHRQS